jgi:hypothetical protein
VKFTLLKRKVTLLLSPPSLVSVVTLAGTKLIIFHLSQALADLMKAGEEAAHTVQEQHNGDRAAWQAHTHNTSKCTYMLTCKVNRCT